MDNFSLEDPVNEMSVIWDCCDALWVVRNFVAAAVVSVNRERISWTTEETRYVMQVILRFWWCGISALKLMEKNLLHYFIWRQKYVRQILLPKLNHPLQQYYYGYLRPEMYNTSNNNWSFLRVPRLVFLKSNMRTKYFILIQSNTQHDITF